MEIKFDDDNFFVHVYELADSKLSHLNHPLYTMVIEIITDDKEALELTGIALEKWFKDRGLS